jgi:hypothetical protein
MNIDSVNQWTGYLRHIPLNLARRAFTPARIRAEIAARTGIHRCNKHKLGRESDGTFGARYGDKAVLQRLTNHLQNLPLKLSKFIEKQMSELNSISEMPYIPHYMHKKTRNIRNCQKAS